MRKKKIKEKKKRGSEIYINGKNTHAVCYIGHFIITYLRGQPLIFFQKANLTFLTRANLTKGKPYEGQT